MTQFLCTALELMILLPGMLVAYLPMRDCLRRCKLSFPCGNGLAVFPRHCYNGIFLCPYAQYYPLEVYQCLSCHMRRFLLSGQHCHSGEWYPESGRFCAAPLSARCFVLACAVLCIGTGCLASYDTCLQEAAGGGCFCTDVVCVLASADFIYRSEPFYDSKESKYPDIWTAPAALYSVQLCAAGFAIVVLCALLSHGVQLKPQ